MSGRRFVHLATLLGLSSSPSEPGTGDLWWRSDRSQLHAADASGPVPIGPTGNLPVVRSGQWHTLPASGGVAAVSLPADRLYALPFYPGRSATVQAMAASITVALAGGSIRMGLYASDGSVPTSRIADFGTVSTGLTGIVSVTGLSAPVRPVLNFLVLVRQGGLGGLTLSGRDTREALISDAVATLTDARTAYYRDTVPGALPATFGAVAGTIQGPSVAVQLG